MQKINMRICSFILCLVVAVVFLPTVAVAEEKALYDISEEFYFGRNALKRLESGENKVAAYDAIVKAVKNGETTISVADFNIFSEDLYMIVDTYIKDHPEAYAFPKAYAYSIDSKSGNGNVGTIVIEYYTGYDKYVFDRMVNKFLDAVSGAKTEYEKALMLYNILEEYVRYDYDALNTFGSNGEILDKEGIKSYTAYGAIVNGKGVCEGYSKAYQYLLQRLGIECYIVTGTSKEDGGAHEWNLIKLDGNYYHADITWDDIGSLDNIYHSYFNITTARILELHTIDDPYGFLPDCSDTNDAYKYENSVTSLNADEIATFFRGDIKKTANFFFTGTPNDFLLWWKSNCNALFNKVSGLQSGVNYSVLYYSVGNEYVIEIAPADYGVTVGGTFLAWGDSNDSIKLELFKQGESVPLHTEYLNQGFNFWTLDDVKNGSYKLVVSKVDHKTREYAFDVLGEDVALNAKIFPIGDVNEDGTVNIRDIVRIKTCLANGETTEACDVDNSGSVDAIDLTEIIEKLQRA